MSSYKEVIDQLKSDARLNLFLNATETKLAKILKPIEELNGNEGFTVGDYNESPFAGFHPSAVRMVLMDDDYYLGCRANHFVLIFGQSEALNDEYIWDDCVVCLANHKGGLCVTVFTFADEEVR